METAYKRRLRLLFACWSEAYEARTGSGTGYPDLQFLLEGVLLPVEVKAGVVENGRLFSRVIRPSQIIWHHNFMCAGGTAYVLVCCGVVARMDAYSLPNAHRETLAAWRQGWPLRKCKQWIANGKLVINSSSLLPILRSTKGT